MSNKEKKKVKEKKSDGELEKRVEEEQKRLLKKQKQEEKNPQQKKQKKEKELSDKVKAKEKGKEGNKESIHRKIDYHRFLEQQQRKLDYAAMFNYLGNLKVNKYEYSDGTPDAVKVAYRKNETLTWDEIKKVTDEEKTNAIMGLNRNFEMNDRRESYKWWKAFNKGLGELLYDVSMT